MRPWLVERCPRGLARAWKFWTISSTSHILSCPVLCWQKKFWQEVVGTASGTLWKLLLTFLVNITVDDDEYLYHTVSIIEIMGKGIDKSANKNYKLNLLKQQKFVQLLGRLQAYQKQTHVNTVQQ